METEGIPIYNDQQMHGLRFFWGFPQGTSENRTARTSATNNFMTFENVYAVKIPWERKSALQTCIPDSTWQLEAQHELQSARPRIAGGTAPAQNSDMKNCILSLSWSYLIYLHAVRCIIYSCSKTVPEKTYWIQNQTETNTGGPL